MLGRAKHTGKIKERHYNESVENIIGSTGQRDSTKDRTLALNVTNVGSIPDIPYGPPSPTRSAEPEVSREHCGA